MQLKLAEVMREWRWSAKETLDEVAKEIGISRATVNRVERGEMPDGHTLAAILKWLLTKS